MSGGTRDERAEGLRDQALAWLVRVQSDRATAEDWTALTEWIEASPENLAAFDEVEQLSAEIDGGAADILTALKEPTGEVVAFRPRTRRVSSARRWAALAAACVVAGLFIGPAVWRAYEGATRTFHTGPGETRTIHLADGSTVHLDVASSLSARLGWRTRRLTLGDAEAAFDVAKDSNRPFLITVGDQVVRVVGTEFNIRHYDRTTMITVRRGVVEVYQPALGAAPVARLTKGWTLSHAEGTNQSIAAETNPDAAFGWTDGRLVCNDEPLSKIVAYLNRRYPTPITLSDAAARRRFTGVLILGDQGDLVRHLSRYLSLSEISTKQAIQLR